MRLMIFLILFPAWTLLWLIIAVGLSIERKRIHLALHFWPYVYNLRFIGDDVESLSFYEKE